MALSHSRCLQFRFVILNAKAIEAKVSNVDSELVLSKIKIYNMFYLYFQQYLLSNYAFVHSDLTF